ncbi:MAG: malonyl-CoA decarboxylase [Zoogloeaceae bacterium]|jgi:malonyl-CoA decarboxylase|nr:malonyl-CoA decarboxylase [Zoogloeaceae bacterium]
MNSLVARSLKKMQGLWMKSAARKKKPFDARALQKVRAQLQECARGAGGEVSARQRARRLSESYLQLDDAGRHAFLRLIATEFGPDPDKVAAAHVHYQASIDTSAQWEAEALLWRALRSPRTRILTQFNALPQGVRFLVDLRVDLLRFIKEDPELASLDRELEYSLSIWFDVGFLELRRITWHSPAALLEKLIQYEAVHTIHSWADLKNRLDSDRRCYGFFHPRMPDEPLIFVEVALTDHLADNVQHLLDEHAPIFDTRSADTAIFYSISNTQTGLRGVSFGNFLLKRVIEDLQRDLPQLKHFSTLSPLPLLRRWAEKTPEIWTHAFLPGDLERIGKLAHCPPTPESIQALLTAHEWAANPRLARDLQNPLTRLAAHYLLTAKAGERRIYDPVARFHLGNGARVERLNFLADTAPKGLQQSYGMMVNYLYAPDDIEENVENLLAGGKIAARIRDPMSEARSSQKS